MSVYVRFCPFSYNKYRAKGFLRMLNYLNAKAIFENVSAIRLKRQGVVWDENVLSFRTERSGVKNLGSINNVQKTEKQKNSFLKVKKHQKQGNIDI